MRSTFAALKPSMMDVNSIGFLPIKLVLAKLMLHFDDAIEEKLTSGLVYNPSVGNVFAVVPLY